MKNLKINKGLLTLMLTSTIALTGCGLSGEKYFLIDDASINSYIADVDFIDEQYKEAVINSYKEGYISTDNYSKAKSITLYNLSSLEDIKTTPDVESLYLNTCRLNDISVLKSLKNLKEVHLYHCDITDPSILGELSKLDTLTISNTYVKDYGFLSNLSNLKSLTINETFVNDFSFLKSMNKLKELNLSLTNFEDLSLISNYKGINKLDLSYTAISDLSGIEKFSNLKNLNISSCENLSDYSIVSKCNKLETFNASGMDMLFDYKNCSKIVNNVKDTNICGAYYNQQKVVKLYEQIGIKDDMTDSEKVRLISSAVLKQIEIADDSYDHEFINEYPFDYAINGVGVCLTYSTLFNAFCEMAGVNSHIIIGENFNELEDNYRHAWNIVEIDGKWYGVDETFIDDDENNYKKIENNEYTEYYLEDLSSDFWQEYHFPYYMPIDDSNYNIEYAR